MNKIKLQKLYQKTEFSHHKINQLSTIFNCCKCRKNNTIVDGRQIQNCIFCGMPNYTIKN